MDRNCFEEAYSCIQKCKSNLRGDLGGIKSLSGVVNSLDETQDLLCRKLTNHLISLCLDSQNTLDDVELESQLSNVLYALLNLKWLLKSFDSYKEKSEQQLQEVVNSVMSVCLGKEAYVVWVGKD